MNMKKMVAWLTCLAMLFSMAATVFADTEEHPMPEEGELSEGTEEPEEPAVPEEPEEPTVPEEPEEPEAPAVYDLSVGGESVNSQEGQGTLLGGAAEYTFADGTFVLTVKKDVALTAPIETTAALVIHTKKAALTVTSNAPYAICAKDVSFIKSSTVTLMAIDRAIETDGHVYVGADANFDGGEELSLEPEENYFSYNGRTWETDTVAVLDMLWGDRRIFVTGAKEDDDELSLTLDETATLTCRVGGDQLEKAVLTLTKANTSHLLVNTTGTGRRFGDLTITVKRDSRIEAKDTLAAIAVCDADVLIKGAGTLTAKGQSGGLIVTGGALTISSNVDVILSKGLTSPEAVSADALTMEGGIVYIDASQPEEAVALKVAGDVVIEREVEHFTAAALGGALLCGGTVTVADKEMADDLTKDTFVEYPVKKTLAHRAMAKYDISVGGMDITEINQDDVLRDGRISYKDASFFLYLDGVSLTEAGIAVNGGNGGTALRSLTIGLSGDNKIDLKDAGGETAIDASDADVYIKGDGTLALTTTGTSIVVENGYMRFAGGDTTMKTTGSEGVVRAQKGIKLTDTEVSKGGSVKSYGDYYGIGTTKKEASEARVSAAEKSSGSSGKSSASIFGGSEKNVLTTYKVTFISFGRVVDTKTISAGDRVTAPSISLDGYTLDGWYTSDIGTDKMDFSRSVPQTMTLYARWIPEESTKSQPLILLTIDSLDASVSGQTRTMDAAAFIEQSRTYTPARFVAEALGAAVTWEEDERCVTITLGDITIELTIDSATAKINGEQVALDAPAVIRDSRTYTPARFVAEALGAVVTWEEDERRVSITK